MKIIAVTNIKGGVGKTTTVVNLAYLHSVSAGRTLLWDLDAQGAATHLLRAEPASISAKRLVNGKQEIDDLPVPTPYAQLDLLPADFSYRNMDLHLAKRKQPTERLLKMSRALREHYQALFLDCPPGASLLSENVLRAADALVVPLVPSPLSVRMLAELYAFVRDNGWSDLLILPFFSMVDRRRALHREILASARSSFPQTLHTEVPYSSDIERMSARRAAVAAYAPASPAGQVYTALWREIEERLGASTGTPATETHSAGIADATTTRETAAWAAAPSAPSEAPEIEQPKTVEIEPSKTLEIEPSKVPEIEPTEPPPPAPTPPEA